MQYRTSADCFRPLRFLPPFHGGQHASDLPVAEQVHPPPYMMEISRGVILRSAGSPELWVKALILFAMGVAVLLVATDRFRKMIV